MSSSTFGSVLVAANARGRRFLSFQHCIERPALLGEQCTFDSHRFLDNKRWLPPRKLKEAAAESGGARRIVHGT